MTTDPAVPEALGVLRDKIDSIDRKVIALLAERKVQVEAVTALKETHGLPVRHPAREEDLISERRSLGKEAGLSPDLMEELFRRIIRESRVLQTAHLSQKGVRPDAKVLIVGASGGMGRYLVKWFSAAGYQVRGMGRKDWDRVEALCDGVDLAIVSVPIEATAAVIRDLSPHLPEGCVLADITSIKTGPMAAMLSSHTGPVVGLHPLFGPTTSSLDKQIVVVTPGRDKTSCSWVTEQFAAWGAILMEASPQEHDEIMAVVQSLRHFATLFVWPVPLAAGGGPEADRRFFKSHLPAGAGDGGTAVRPGPGTLCGNHLRIPRALGALEEIHQKPFGEYGNAR